MSQATIALPNRQTALALFGVQDRHLKRVRAVLGVRAVLRDGQLHLEGDQHQVAQAVRVFDQLRTISEQHGALDSEAVERVLAMASDGPSEAEQTIELLHKSRRLRPRTPGQRRYVEAIRKNDVILCSGPAGSGKTYLAVAMAVNALKERLLRKIVLVRPAVEAGERLGFLPGDAQAKINPYQRPLLDALHEMIEYDQIRRYMDNDLIEIIPLAYMRGRTLNDSFIILDEGQNTTVPQMKMFLTRMGLGSKIVVGGDVTQIDLPPQTRSGLKDAMKRLKGIDRVAVVALSEQDIVRHPLVHDIVRAYDAPGPDDARPRD
jgi:phosphate starvation-inducible PhoH-like protein